MAMALLLKLDSVLLLIIVYLPPSLRKAETTAVWMELEHYVSKFLMECPNARVLLGGDLVLDGTKAVVSYPWFRPVCKN